MIPDEDFCKKLPDIITAAWVDNEMDEKILSEKHGIDMEKIKCMIDLTGDAFVSLSRDIVRKEKLASIYKKHLSERKADALISQISIRLEHQRNTMLFANVPDMLVKVNQISQQNNVILNLLQELINLRREERKRRGE